MLGIVPPITFHATQPPAQSRRAVLPLLKALFVFFLMRLHSDALTNLILFENPPERRIIIIFICLCVHREEARPSERYVHYSAFVNEL